MTLPGRDARRADLAAGALVVWTWFVWIGRIRNVVADTSVDDAGRFATLALSSSFVVLAGVLASLVVLDRRRRRGRVARRAATWLLALWSTLVWSVRSVDIAWSGEHSAGFVAVHVALAAVSVALAAMAVATAGTLHATVPDAEEAGARRRGGQRMTRR